MFRLVCNGVLIVEQLSIADTFGARLKGLLETQYIQRNSGLLIRPCSAVHTFGMRYPISVVFFSRDGVVLKTINSLPPCRLGYMHTAYQALELAAGEVRRLGIEQSCLLQVERESYVGNND